MLSFLISAAAPRPPLLIHVMPWFEAKDKDLGWHWRMNRTAEQVRKEGRVASHYQPWTGPYDSTDRRIVELQVAWMKFSGFDGLLANWYGTLDRYDYPFIHRATRLLFQVATDAGLTIGVVYEDQTIGAAIRTGFLPESEAPAQAKRDAAALRSWASQPNWLKLGGKKSVLVFGPQRLAEDGWAAFRSGFGDMNLLTLHRRQPYGQGVFDWPVPSAGMDFSRRYAERSKDWGLRVAGAFPRFRDFYEEGGQTGYPDLPDRDGQTYRETLRAAMESGSDAVQVATWNDWQEGTQIEPSKEIGMRDLLATQQARRRRDPGFKFGAEELDLAWKVYSLRIERPAQEPELAKASLDLLRGDVGSAIKRLAELGP